MNHLAWLSVPLFMDGQTLVSIVLSRRGLEFSEHDRERLESLRPHLEFLYRQACQDPMLARLTPKEAQVMQWVSCGKTDADIAALLAISRRTVHKHLEHIYVKLGVETRTAAVMRAGAMVISEHRPGRGTSSPGTRPCRGASLRGPAPTA